MIRIKNATAKNFLSIGNALQSVNFSNGDLTLVLGENLDLGGDDSGARNGVGKSAILNLISYGLYGQSLSNIKKENLVNKTNGKGLIVTLDFEVDGENYRIIRGRRPNILQFFKNDIEQRKEETTEDDSQGDSRETQKEIERILGLSHTMFTHIVGLNTYTIPFLALRVHEQREIIEQLLGITLLSEKAEALKNEIKTTKESINKEEIRVKSLQAANARIQEQINATKRRQKVWQQTKQKDIAELDNAIDQLGSIDIEQELANHQLLKSYYEWKHQFDSLTQLLDNCGKNITKDEKELSRVEADLSALKEQKCPSCNQSVNADKLASMVESKKQRQKDLQSSLKSLRKEFGKHEKEVSALGENPGQPDVFYDDLQQAYDHKNQLDLLIAKKTQREADIDPYEEQIREMQNHALVEVSMDSLNQLTRLNEHQDFLLRLLVNKDSFIRKKIIEQNLAYLNVRLDHYITEMGLPHKVTFLNDLSVSITEFGRDFDFDSLSRGERNRVILALSWSFRDVWESLYKKINLIFHDEILDSGMDAAGVESAFHLLKNMNRESRRDVWIVSHREELTGRVSNVFKVQKENGFTSFLQD